MTTILAGIVTFIVGIFFLILTIHFEARFIADRVDSFDDFSPFQRKLLAVIVCPVISYFLFIGVLWLSGGLLFYASEMLALPTGTTMQFLFTLLYLVVPVILAIFALVRWIIFQADRLELPAFGVVMHSIIVALALVGTLVWLVLKIEEHRRCEFGYMKEITDQSAAPLPRDPHAGNSEDAR